MSFSELTTAIQNTLLVTLICSAIALPLGTLLALLLVRTDVAGRKMAWIAIGSQLAVPLYVFAGGWSAGFGLQGWLSSWGLPAGSTLGVGMLGTLQDGWRTLAAVAVVHALAAVPWVTFLLSLGLVWTNRGEEEQAILDGGWHNTLLRVVLPKLRVWLAAAAMWCVMPILTEMVVSNLYQLPTVAEQVYLDASRGSVSTLTYPAATLLCTVPLAAGLLVLMRFFPDWQEVIFRASHFRASVFELKRWRIPLTCVTWTIVLLLVGLPILSLIAKAGWQPFTGADGKTHYGWSLQRLARTAYESVVLFQSEFFWSGLLGLLASSCALGISALVLAAANRTARFVMSCVMVVAISLPGPLVGMLVIRLMNRSEPAWLGELYDHSIAAPILAQQFRLMPMAWIIMCTLIACISRSTWEQVKLDGLSRLQILRNVLIPQTGRTFLAAWLLLFVLSMGELSCSILVLPPGVTTISMRLFEMLHFGMRHQDSGICAILLLFGWLVSMTFWKTLSER